MGFGLKEAIEIYIKSGQTGDMAVRVDESADIIAIGKRGGVVVPIVRPGSKVTAQELMQKAQVNYDRPIRRGVHILSPFTTIRLPSRWQKKPTRLH